MEIEDRIDEIWENTSSNKSLLFVGYSGLGKTYQAQRVAEKYGLAIKGVNDVIDRNCVLFIDEAQMYSVAEQQKFINMIDNPIRHISGGLGVFNLKKVLARVILATTTLDKIIEPLQTRSYKIMFNFYDRDIIKDIILRHYPNMPDKWLDDIATRSKGNARIAINIADVANNIGLEKAFQLLKIDELGLEEEDRYYLATLFKREYASVNTISTLLGYSKEAIIQVIEPYLQRLNFINITSRGRSLTQEGKDYILNFLNNIGNKND
mgnify:FL=1